MATTEYFYSNERPAHTNGYLLPALLAELGQLVGEDRRVFDLGCGNGSIGRALADLGYAVTGVDPSVSGIEHANRAYPDLDLHVGSAYDDLASVYGSFPVVISLEVVEHVYAPRDYARTLAALTRPGGAAIVSTPYHGYLKNLALAASGRMDDHFTALWDHGHIKFWSIDTLGRLLGEVGLTVERVHRIGRIPQLAKSMMLVCRKA